MKRLPPVLLASVAALVVLVLLPACTVVNPPALTVGTWSLSREDFLDQLATLSKNNRLPGASGAGAAGAAGTVPPSYDPKTTAQVLSVQAQYQVLKQELDRRGIAITDEDRTAALDQLAQNSGGGSTGQQRTGAQVDQVLTSYGSLKDVIIGGQAADIAIGRALVSNDEVTARAKADYDANKEKLQKTCLSLIHQSAPPRPTASSSTTSSTAPRTSAPTEADYAAALSKVQTSKTKIDGGQKFADVAKTDSDDPQTSAQGGQFQCLTADQLQQLPDAALTAVQRLALNVVSDPIRLEGDGYYLFLVTSRDTPTFDQVQQELENNARTELATPRSKDAVAQAAKTIPVTVDPLFGSWDAAAFQVVPPNGAEHPSTTATSLDTSLLNNPLAPGGATTPTAASPTTEPRAQAPTSSTSSSVPAAAGSSPSSTATSTTAATGSPAGAAASSTTTPGSSSTSSSVSSAPAAER